MVLDQGVGVLEQSFSAENVNVYFSIESGKNSLKAANFIHYK